MLDQSVDALFIKRGMNRCWESGLGGDAMGSVCFACSPAWGNEVDEGEESGRTPRSLVLAAAEEEKPSVGTEIE